MPAPRHLCANCGKRYVQRQHLRRHELAAHGAFACQTCSKRFKVAKNLESHARISKTTPCTLYERIFCSVDDLECHLRTDHPMQRGAGASDEYGDSGMSEEVYEAALDELVLPPTGHQNTVGFEFITRRHFREIRDRVKH